MTVPGSLREEGSRVIRRIVSDNVEIIITKNGDGSHNLELYVQTQAGTQASRISYITPAVTTELVDVLRRL